MKAYRLLAFLALLFLAGCGTFQVEVESTPNESGSLTASPAAAQLLAPTQPSPTAQAATEPQMVNIYLIALEDNGQSGSLVGCGDSLVPVQVQISPTKEVLKAAVEALISLQGQYYGESGLYNALYQSDLRLNSVNIKDGEAIIDLSGTLLVGGECDDPRIEAQIHATALQFSTVSKVSVTINGRALQDALSLK